MKRSAALLALATLIPATLGAAIPDGLGQCSIQNTLETLLFGVTLEDEKCIISARAEAVDFCSSFLTAEPVTQYLSTSTPIATATAITTEATDTTDTM
jgi:hypothetical protein